MAIVVDLKKYEYTGPLDMLLDMIHEGKIFVYYMLPLQEPKRN